ncbi:MAG: pyridoxamine 5'-phosphate oxidase family protein [Phototrophicaceae bacterium]
MSKRQEDVKKVQEIMDNHQTVMFATHTMDGSLVSRPMTTQSPEKDGDIWFFVSSDADVIDEIEANDAVNVAYIGKDQYVSVAGKAVLVDDDAKKKELWYDELEQWFEGSDPESPDVKLIKVDASTARFWDGRDSGKIDY